MVVLPCQKVEKWTWQKDVGPQKGSVGSWGGSARGRYGFFFLPSEAGQAFFGGDGCGSNGAGGAPRLCQVRVWCWLRQNGGGEGCGGSFSVTWQFWELARSRCFRTLTGRALCSSVALVHRSRVRPLARSALVADGVARWWRHDDEQEAGPVSAALLNAFLNSADFICRAYMWSNRAIAGSLGRRLRSCSRLGW